MGDLQLMAIPRHRKDGNHDAIVQALRDAHALVFDVHGWDNCLDLIVCRGGQTFWLELKDGALPPSRRQLTEAEQDTIQLLATAGVEAKVVTDVPSALRAVGLL
jgi:hypothetical protein